MSTLKTEVSRILFKPEPSHQHNELLAEAHRAAALGGTFTIRHYYETAWWEEFSITYPVSDGVVILTKAESALALAEKDAVRYRACREYGLFSFTSDRMTDDEIDSKIDVITRGYEEADEKRAAAEQVKP